MAACRSSADRWSPRRQWARRGVLLPALLLWTASGVPLAHDNAGAELFVIANTQYSVMHEMGHVIVSELNIPVLGKEEDAADQLATIVLLRSKMAGPAVAERLLAAADGWLMEWRLDAADRADPEYWDSHSLDIQRYYNINCLVYGSNPAAFAEWQDSAEDPLPYPRAWKCEDEYRRSVRTLRWIAATLRAPASRTRRNPSGRVGVIYERPSTPEAAAVEKLLRTSGVLEQSARIIESQFALPYDIHIVLTNICGTTAYWRHDRKEIIVCYRLVEHFSDLAAQWPCASSGQASSAAATAGVGHRRNSCTAIPDR